MLDAAFTTGPMDPPSAFKAGWKSVRLQIALGSTEVTIYEKTILDSLNALSIATHSYRLQKISVWVMPDVTAGSVKPSVILTTFDPLGGGNAGSREDTGLLSRAAHLHFRYSSATRMTSSNFPPPQTTGIKLCKIEASHAKGDIQISLQYSSGPSNP
jgi:hypothetical protein